MFLRLCRSCLIVVALAFSACSSAQSLKDLRRVPITLEEFVRHIHSAPLDFSVHERLLSRADASGMYKAAYQECTTLCKQHPNEWTANLLCGEAALDYWAWAVDPAINEIPLLSPQAQSLLDDANRCLRKAYNIEPTKPIVQMVYGYYLWQYGQERGKGLQLLKQALVQQPKSARVYFLLGNYYQSTADSEYDPRKAEQHLTTSIRLDPAFASAHFSLVRLYMRLFRYQDADRELKVYQSLLPSQNANSKGIQMYAKEIQVGLAKTRTIKGEP